MTRPCDEIEAFMDGELPPEQAEAFRLHLPDCERCQREMENIRQLNLLGWRYTLQAAQLAKQPAPPAKRPAPRTSVIPPWMMRPAFLAGAGAFAVALVAVTVTVLSPSGPRQDVWLAERPQRLLEARVSYPEADRHRPQSATMMGGDGLSEALPLEEMARLEKGDLHGLAAAYLVRDDPGLVDQALQKLEKLGHSPDLDSDRAAAMLLKRKPDEALRHADSALAQNPRHPQALWNRGLALRELGLPLMAARTFEAVTALQEPGWAEEAAQRAKTLQGFALERKARWQAWVQAGKTLVEQGPVGSLPEGFTQAPIARRYFYEAVHAAPTPERVLALLPLAQELDARAGGHVLEGYLRRIATADFSRRTPLARDFLILFQQKPEATEKKRIVEAALASKEDDLLMGVLVKAAAVGDHLSLFEEKAQASGDPWFQVIAAQEGAVEDKEQAHVERATQRLQDALGRCLEAGLTYRCILLESELATLYSTRHQLDLARKHAQSGWEMARSANEWRLETNILWSLAQIAQLVSNVPLARAYYGEFLERSRGEPDMEFRSLQKLAAISVHELRVDEARREMDAALSTGQRLLLSGAFTLADISRMKPAPGDEAHLTGALEKLMPNQGPGEHALSTHILGRFFIERDVQRGRTLLLRAIEEAGARGLEEDVNADKARVYSFTSLMLEAGRRGAFDEALELFSRERGQPLPDKCLLAATTDSERTLLIVRGRDGALIGRHDEARRQPLPETLDGLVPEELLAPLRACSKVEVFARPPLHGRAGLLPAELPWSYLTRTSPARAARPGPAVHLVVSDVEMPPGVPLKRLNAWTSSFGPEEQPITLTGSEATPSRVLSLMRSATEIDLVAHGIINESSDDTYLLLAPERGGPREGVAQLGLAQVRNASLEGAPFVVLAACRAARTAYVLHEPFSLPAAFIEAGARGVLAATEEIPDLEAEKFFNAVRQRVRSGTAPAVALRDERSQWLREGRGTQWLDSVLLFE